MKKTTCKHLKGACDLEITGATPEEMVANAKQHAMEMLMKGDADHIAAMEEMQKMSKEDQEKWFQEEFVGKFDELEDV